MHASLGNSGESLLTIAQV